jgi:hypothetical protein
MHRQERRLVSPFARRLLVDARHPIRAKIVRDAFLALPTVKEEGARISLARAYHGPGHSVLIPALSHSGSQYIALLDRKVRLDPKRFGPDRLGPRPDIESSRSRVSLRETKILDTTTSVAFLCVRSVCLSSEPNLRLGLDQQQSSHFVNHRRFTKHQ